jgi:3-phenylpropionate/trans-cinnamate dioxygenase ferredoxin subunit
MNDEASDDSWHLAGVAAEFEDEDVEQLWVGELAIAVYRAEGQFYATQDLCTHERAYLSDGVVVDCVVECPFHQGRFDVRTGKALGAPVIEPLETYPIKIVAGRLYVHVTKEQAQADPGSRPQTGLEALRLKKDRRP